MRAKHNSGIFLSDVANDYNMFSCGSSHSIDKFEPMIFGSRLTNGFFARLGGQFRRTEAGLCLQPVGLKRDTFKCKG